MSNVRYSALALGASLIALFLTAGPASAQTAAFGFTPNAFGVTDNASDTGAASYNLGYEFTVGGSVPITVTSLGYFNEPSFDPATPFNTVNLNPEPGGSYTYATDHLVGLYDTGGNLLASADITSAGTPDGDFLYSPLASSLTLGPGDYILAGVTGPTDPFMFNVEDDTQPGFVGLVSSFPITWDEDVATQGSDLTAFPGLGTTDGAGPGYFGPNFQFSGDSVVPESGSLALILPSLLILAALAALRRRRLQLLRRPAMRSQISNTSLYRIATIAILLTVALTAQPALAQGPSVNLTQLAAQVAADHATINNLQNTVNAQQATINAQAAAIAALQAKTAPISIQDGVGTGTELFFTGVNLHVVNGLGATNGDPSSPYIPISPVTNGLGNVIIGYNELRAPIGGSPDLRTGSHNLILGLENNYSSYGGIVGGESDSISSFHASVITGFNNTASGIESVLIGGQGNVASGIGSVVTGGAENTASNQNSVATGGVFNTASGSSSVATGGSNNTASGFAAVVTGGLRNTASGQAAEVTGGFVNTASGQDSEVTGGAGNTASGTDSIAP